MTRETKVGLVVGTGIILLIGIVVSDHLASQQRGQQQTPAPPGYSDLSTGPTRSINPQGVRPVDAAKERENRAVAPLPPAGDDRGRTTAVGILNVGPNGTAAPGTTGANGGTATDPNAGAPGDRNLAGNTGATSALPPDLRNALRDNNFLPEDPTPRLANNGGLGTGTGNGATNTNSGANTGNTGVRPTEPLIHHVQPGDTLWAIAEKFYGVGNGRYSDEIAKANPDKMMATGGVRAGVRLVIPNKVITTPGSSVAGVADRNAGTSTTDTAVAPPAGNNGNNGNTNTSAARPAGRTVKVEPGDSLSMIASRTLGSVKHMQLIVDANRDQIHDADDIKAGMTLRVPELPAAATPAPRTTANGTTPTTTPGTPAPASAAKVHKVQPRDTFTSIARTRLGSEKRWKEIYDLNKDKVGSPDALREGIVLALPTDARP